MSITYQIPHVPLLSQLSEPTVDGQPDENTRMNCVFASNAAIATAYLGKPFYGDQLKDSDPNYGQGYTGGASERNLISTMAKLGITITRAPSPTQQGLVDIIHREVSAGHGVIITMPSQWNSAPTLAGASWNPRTYSGPSHVGLACGVGPAEIRVMNPWGGFWHDGSDSYWAARLLAGEVWVATMATASTTTTANGVPTGWKDDGKTLIAPNGVPVIGGIRLFVLAYAGGWEADNYPLQPEQQVAQLEWGNLTHGPGARQDFRYRSLACPHHPDGSWGPTYRVWVGQDVLALSHQLDAANKHAGDLAAQVASLQAQLAAALAAAKPDPVAAACLAAVQAFKAALGEL